MKVIIKPIVTEKMTQQTESLNDYGFVLFLQQYCPNLNVLPINNQISTSKAPFSESTSKISHKIKVKKETNTSFAIHNRDLVPPEHRKMPLYLFSQLLSNISNTYKFIYIVRFIARSNKSN